jgi:hypothetical protein
MLDPTTGQWVDDENDPAKLNAGDIGAQTDAPVIPGPPAPGGPMHYVQTDPTVITAGPDPGTDVLPQPAPALPQPAPYMPQAMPPIPPGRVVSPAESQNLGAIDANTAATMASAKDQGALSDAGAQAKLQASNRDTYADQARQADQARTADEFAKRVAQREQQAQADYQQYKSFGIKDPQADDSFATRILKAIVIGMGQYAAGMTGGQNTALHIIQSANEQNIARQKAQQEKLLGVAERSGKDVEATKKERDDAFKQLDLKHAAMLESSAGMLRQELARIGVPQAQIDSNEAVQKVEKDALAIRERTLQSIRDDETALAKADIAAKARADAARMRKGKGGAGGGGAGMEARAQLAEYAQANPGDTAGLYRLGAKLSLGKKDVDSALNQNKVTEGGGKDAQQGATALRAIDSIEKSGYTPSREDIQKWMGNQRDVARAQSMSEGKGIGGALSAGIANIAQKKGVLAQNEFDGLDPKAREYFSNVRRYMETIGRVQSGAAISQSEWQNFYGQYGPQAEGGLDAARQFARDRFKMSGVAGRVLERSAGAVPQGGGGKGGDDPRAKLAREAIADPHASTAVKARALQILKSLGASDAL